MSVVIKLGGEVLEPTSLDVVAASVARVRAVNVVIVHGGGPQATALSQTLGVATRTIAGRRITDAATLDVLAMVVAGKLNVNLCVALQRHGIAAIGLHAGSGVVRAHRRPPRIISGGPAEPVDLGLVGDVTSFDLPLLEALWQQGRLPVLSCLGLGLEPVEPLNLNADLVASQLASALHAVALVAVTAVGGVRANATDPTTRIPRLSAAQAKAAIARGDVHGGMIPKLEEAFIPLEAGVPAVHIVGPSEIAQSLDHPGSVGTLLTV